MLSQTKFMTKKTGRKQNKTKMKGGIHECLSFTFHLEAMRKLFSMNLQKEKIVLITFACNQQTYYASKLSSQ